MVFTCRQCGTCCMYLGDYIVIEQQTGPFRFACESVSTGTPFTAEIDEDKRGIFLDRTFPDQHPHACRFLRPDGALLRCTIHRDSPAQCKYLPVRRDEGCRYTGDGRSGMSPVRLPCTQTTRCSAPCGTRSI